VAARGFLLNGVDIATKFRLAVWGLQLHPPMRQPAAHSADSMANWN
jgi:hypothetical protein